MFGIRGYGTNGQYADVFSTLCNYAGLEAFFTWAGSFDRENTIPISFVKIYNRWYIFDPYNGIYFRNKDGNFAAIEDMSKGEYGIASIVGVESREHFNYKSVFNSLFLIINDTTVQRARIQFPLNRLIFEVKKWVNVK